MATARLGTEVNTVAKENKAVGEDDAFGLGLQIHKGSTLLERSSPNKIESPTPPVPAIAVQVPTPSPPIPQVSFEHLGVM